MGQPSTGRFRGKDGAVDVGPTDILTDLPYAPGAHLAAGTCQVPHDQSEQVLHELIEKVGAPMSSSAGRKG
ncbi:hypothetical protein [Dactylosporangium sp. NPDC049140]|jgi:hypothetical protein|uniref:hypothetical protein n=1 Tax=Dactylosporangium sp. NPDC049140 TaxID=3155647 RepID=UPI0033CDDB1A